MRTGRLCYVSPGHFNSRDYMYKSFENPIVLNYSMERKTIFSNLLRLKGVTRFIFKT